MAVSGLRLMIRTEELTQESAVLNSRNFLSPIVFFALLEATGALGAFQNASRYGPSASGAFCQHVMDILDVGRQLLSPGASGGKKIPILLEQRLLQITITQSACSQPVLNVFAEFRRRDQFDQLYRDILFRI